MNRSTFAAALCSTLLASAFLSGCNSSNFTPPTESIAATSGAQSAPVNTQFGQLVATVTLGGAPVSGAFVTFTAPATGASGTFASTSTNTETDPTDATGKATSSTFTANGILGADPVTASVAGVIATTTFNLTNASGPPATITATSGSLQGATISTAFSAPLVVTVVDANQYPVTGATVTFTAPASGATGAFSNGTNTETDTTNASGVATSSQFTADATAGVYMVTAAVSGVTTTASFTLTNVIGALEAISATSGTPQSASVNAPFSAPFVATVVDSNSSPVSGVTVTFAAPSLGAGGTFANGTATDTETTNASGVATSTAFTANGSVGTYTVTASVASGSEPANFTLTNTPLSFAFYVSGLETLNEYEGVPNYYALAGSVTLDGNGNVLGGEQDYNDGLGLTSPQPSGDTILPAAAALIVDPTTGQGTLTLTTDNSSLGVNGVETFAVQFASPSHALIVQFDGSATSSGSMDLQTLSSTLNDGNYAFTLSGVDSSYYPIVYGGVFSISNTGTTLAGTFDVDDFGATNTPTLNTAFTGTITGPDSMGRGTITSTALAISLNYYVVGPEAIRIIDVDSVNQNTGTGTDDSAIGSAFGQGNGTFSNASLGSSVFGVASNASSTLSETAFAAAGMFSVPAAGAFSGVADDNEFNYEFIVPDAPISGTYTIASNGYGSSAITAGDLGDVSVFGIYMTDPALNLNDPNNTTSGLGGALIADLDGFTLNGTGVLTPQTDTSTSSFAGPYALGAQTYNDLAPLNNGREFDLVGQGVVNPSLTLTKGLGQISDPFFAFSATPASGTDTDVRLQGTIVPDGVNAGRYNYQLDATLSDGTPTYFHSVLYQASGDQLFWVDVDPNGKSVFLGSFQQQSSLTGIPAVEKARSKTQSKRKP
ncbi:MAG: hypothetical protein WAK29_18355 [Terriglobales bacterium]